MIFGYSLKVKTMTKGDKKEDILTKCLIEKYKVKFPDDEESEMIAYVKWLYADENGAGIMLRGLEVAMDEYAKQQAVAFGEWADEHYFRKWDTNNTNIWCVYLDDSETFTTHQLYDIFLDHQNKQP